MRAWLVGFLFEGVEGLVGQCPADGDHLHRPVKFQAPARRARHLDQQVGRVGRQRMARQRGLGDVDRPIHHLEAAQFRNFRRRVG